MEQQTECLMPSKVGALMSNIIVNFATFFYIDQSETSMMYFQITTKNTKQQNTMAQMPLYVKPYNMNITE
jgi:hypothetical protein